MNWKNTILISSRHKNLVIINQVEAKMNLNNFEIEKYKGTTKFFTALGTIDNKPYMLIARVANNLRITMDSDYISVGIDKFMKSHSTQAIIRFIVNNNDNSLFTLFKLNHTDEFDTINQVLEIYG